MVTSSVACCQFRCQELRLDAVQIDSFLAQDRDDFRVNSFSRLRARRYGARFSAVAHLVEPCGGHLGSSGVVDTSEQYGIHQKPLLASPCGTTISGAVLCKPGTSQRNRNSQLSFFQNLDGDTEAITVHLVPSGVNLHVRVEVVVSPD
jgi:hypothetical protein